MHQLDVAELFRLAGRIAQPLMQIPFAQRDSASRSASTAAAAAAAKLRHPGPETDTGRRGNA